MQRDICGRILEEPGLTRQQARRDGKQRNTDCTCSLCWDDAHCPVCDTALCWHGPVDLSETPNGTLQCATHTQTLPHGAPLTTGQLTVWLDALTRQYGPDMPLYLQGNSVDAPAEVCLDARVQQGPGGKRVVVLSAQALPRREG